MRLDRLTIGSQGPAAAHGFKNLQGVTIDFAEDHWVTVIIGWNGSGKSNVLEALAIIFRDLIQRKARPQFAFKLDYRIGNGSLLRWIHVDADPERDAPLLFFVARAGEVRGPEQEPPVQRIDARAQGEQVSPRKFFADDAENLPRYVFSYYSGDNRRMRDIFAPYLAGYDRLLRKGSDPGLKRLFYTTPLHGQFVLLALLAEQDPTTLRVLEDHLNLRLSDALDSALLVLREPRSKTSTGDGDTRFWNASGVVVDFLGRVLEVALAPIELRKGVANAAARARSVAFKYLYIKDLTALRALLADSTAARLFRDLEAAHSAGLIEELRIHLRLKYAQSSVDFRELSEGEQQFLAVLGLLRFSSQAENLYLLDEPDTHINPRWSVNYLAHLHEFIGEEAEVIESSHVVMTTHNPMAIAELRREQVQILHSTPSRGVPSISSSRPTSDPRGMGYAAIISSDMFGIISSLDTPTFLLLEKQRVFASITDLSSQQQVELDGVNDQLGRLGFRFFHPDEEYSRYLRMRNDALARRFAAQSATELVAISTSLSRDERDELAKELVEAIVEQQSEGQP